MEYTRSYSDNPNTTAPNEPLIELTVANCFKEGLVTKDNFIIDSGSEITVIRKQIFDVLDLDIYDDITVCGANDKESQSSQWLTSYVFIELSQLGIKERFEVAINPVTEENLLGRDFLRHIKVLFDGPQEIFTIFNE